MDPYKNQRDSRRNNNTYPQDTSGVYGNKDSGTPETPDRNQPDNLQQQRQQADRQPQYSGGFTVIPPNESRRSKITMMAQKEEQELQKWKEANRPSSVRLNPEKLGGNVSLAEAREKQLTELRCSKLQKKLKKEEMDRRKRQEEEEELQRMKAVQRQKAELLEEKRRQEDQMRREQYKQDHLRANKTFLQRFERTAPGPLASSSATHTSSRSESKEGFKKKEPKSERDVLQQHKRVNTAFLDRLEGRGRANEERESVQEEEERPYFKTEESNSAWREPPATYLDPEPDTDWAQEADPDPDYDWALMKLVNSFPNFSKEFLEDILNQCNGDYEQAYVLLISTLS
ncbi:epithelial-stromal interaction protein 1 [Xyrichtys novacula]|uniref:Epithelial-stromal interaction protein 1 n=1 Tax=Xyrichtys novacula TaxID=13765 RepID=A0AAV1GYS3_XYRNO|nr:epithelial-stromal interaction protein 1 [Xyrichtys novacula]